jgi:hypothetical protein
MVAGQRPLLPLYQRYSWIDLAVLVSILSHNIFHIDRHFTSLKPVCSTMKMPANLTHLFLLATVCLHNVEAAGKLGRQRFFIRRHRAQGDLGDV